MRVVKLTAALALIASMSACSLFLGPDPDDSPRGIFERIWTDFDETYALFEHKGIDWNSVYRKFSPQIHSDMTDKELFDVCANMLKVLDDAHVSLLSPFAHSNSAGRLDPANSEPFSRDVARTYLSDGGTITKDGMFLYGTFSSNPEIGYIHINAFIYGTTGIATSQDWALAIDGIVQSLSHTSSLVLDVRGNRGGLPSNVNYIAARFASSQKDYAQIRTKSGPGLSDFSSHVTNTIKPDGTRYTKPVALLTNKQTISGGEWFTLALRSQEHVTHVGSATNGALSLSLERPLVNGWLYTVSVQIVNDMDGICHEGTGIRPKHEVSNSESELAAGQDKQLEYTRELF